MRSRYRSPSVEDDSDDDLVEIDRVVICKTILS